VLSLKQKIYYLPLSLTSPLLQIVSGSQAKRLVSRFEKFKPVILDFEHVEETGQAFADKIFKVFDISHCHDLKAIEISHNE
uniref:STAS-like domain-containing protein n=1 Tax=Chlorobium sp. KB01 TaxID=1917528 RepID=UPI0011849710